MDRVIHLPGIAALKIGAATAADQQAVTGERQILGVEHVAHATGGMSRGRPDAKIVAAEVDFVAVAKQAIRPCHATLSRYRDLTADALAQQPRPGHVIGMDMIHGSFNVLFNLYLLAIGFDVRFIGLRLMIQAIARSVTAVPAGLGSDRIGRKATLVAALLTMGISTVVIGLSEIAHLEEANGAVESGALPADALARLDTLYETDFGRI